jgi:hypothetical protein
MVFVATPKLLSQCRTEDIDTRPHAAAIIIDADGRRTQEVAGHPGLFVDNSCGKDLVPQSLDHTGMDHRVPLTAPAWIILIPLTEMGIAWSQSTMTREIPPRWERGPGTQSMPGHHKYANVGVWSQSSRAVGVAVSVSTLGGRV